MKVMILLPTISNIEQEDTSGWVKGVIKGYVKEVSP